jgi:cytochrome c oxidase subunit IV
MTHDVAVQVRGYFTVFGTLLTLTVITVAVSYLGLSPTSTVALALAIATAKAALVALFFMHLLHEKSMVYLALTLTAVFFFVLIGFTIWSESDHVLGTRFTQPYDALAPAHTDGAH